MSAADPNKSLELLYTLYCDDVRLEVGNKLSLMGVFQNIMVEDYPLSLIKFAVINHWRGSGVYLSQIIILSPDRTRAIVASQPTRFEIAPGGFAHNISFFVNVTFPAPGHYLVQTLIDSNLYDEQSLMLTDGRESSTQSASDAVN